MSDVLKSYYIGDPDEPYKRGQSKNKQVHCLCWLLIYKKGKFFANKNEYKISKGGSGIGTVKSIKEAKSMLYQFAVRYLKNMQNERIDELSRINKALKELGSESENLDKFMGEYKD